MYTEPTICPWARRTSASRNLMMICSAVNCFLAIPCPLAKPKILTFKLDSFRGQGHQICVMLLRPEVVVSRAEEMRWYGGGLKVFVGIILGFFSGFLIYLAAALLFASGEPSSAFVFVTFFGGWVLSTWILVRGVRTISKVFSSSPW